MPSKSDSGTAGDFERLVRAESRRVTTLALRITGDPGAARDVSQEVFLSAWRVFRRRSKVANWRAYLYKATVREALRQTKKRPRQCDSLEEVADTRAQSAQESADLSELRAALAAALSKLPERQALAFTLARVEGFPYRECALVMGCSESAARVQAHRAMRKLARMMDGFRPNA